MCKSRFDLDREAAVARAAITQTKRAVVDKVIAQARLDKKMCENKILYDSPDDFACPPECACSLCEPVCEVCGEYITISYKGAKVCHMRCLMKSMEDLRNGKRTAG